jgi:hypothetical protein
MGTGLILPDLMIPSRVHQRWQYSGMDSIEHCLDKKHFKAYPWHIDYSYNERGFRDREWPSSRSELKDAIWCVGDSFTVGIGQPLEHTWPYVLEQRLNHRTINISMDGASNDWIYRRAEQIQTEIQPRLLVVMWTYTHRRESADSHLEDEYRRIHSSRASIEQDFQHWVDLASKLRTDCKNLIESTIPGFQDPAWMATQASEQIKNTWEKVKDPSWPTCPETLDEFDALPDHVLKELKDLHHCYDRIRSLFLRPGTEICPTGSIHIGHIIAVTQRLDWARDHHHFDILTSEWLVGQILQKIRMPDFSRNDFLPVSEH